jgi:uncharacterized repeat protein (TIGR02543 family)
VKKFGQARRSGYTFTGWHRRILGDEVKEIAPNHRGDKSLEAKWEKNKN